MTQIRLVSDLRNKFPEVEGQVPVPGALSAH